MSLDWRQKYIELAKRSIDKPAKWGPDINIAEYLPMKAKDIQVEKFGDILGRVGIDIEDKDRAGSFYQFDSTVVSVVAKQPGIEILSLEDAIDKYGDDIKEYYWNAVRVDTDKYTAVAELKGSGGYFIRVKKGHRIRIPIQACLLMQMQGSLQAPHNIIIAEENSEVSIVTGCTAMRETVGLHAGITEIYVGKHARVNYVMIHNWGEAMHIRPRTGVVVEEEGVFSSHYIAFTKLRTFQSMPVVVLKRNAKAYLSSIIALKGSAIADSGYLLNLEGEGSNGQIISRSITRDRSEIIARAKIVGLAKGVRGHIDCQGLLLSNNSEIITTPILEARFDDVSLTHEAAVGKLSEEKIIWLMARGFSRDEAEAILVRGFMRVELPELPEMLKSMIEQTTRMIAKSVL